MGRGVSTAGTPGWKKLGLLQPGRLPPLPYPATEQPRSNPKTEPRAMSIVNQTDTRPQRSLRPLPESPAPSAPRASQSATEYAATKRALDILLTLPLLVVAAPVVLVAAALVKLTSRGPAFYTQTRLGRGGTPFRMLKIRSMVQDSESLTGARWSTPGDPRVTTVGRFLRLSHVDELPQLWNILRGDMSLVGPRPERPEFIPQLERALPGYRDRLLVRPGLTGLAQVQLPPDTDLASVRRKLALDLHYVDHQSAWLDLRILLATAFLVAGLPFRVTRALLRVPGEEDLTPAYPQHEALSA
jgi:lipopolysaccharide/colanic/teichoic acid biosynthesis glycosyltransferase